MTVVVCVVDDGWHCVMLCSFWWSVCDCCYTGASYTPTGSRPLEGKKLGVWGKGGPPAAYTAKWKPPKRTPIPPPFLSVLSPNLTLETTTPSSGWRTSRDNTDVTKGSWEGAIRVHGGHLPSCEFTIRSHATWLVVTLLIGSYRRRRVSSTK